MKSNNIVPKNFKPEKHYQPLFNNVEKIDKVISLLKQGEKFEQMWGEHKNILKELKEKALKIKRVDDILCFQKAYMNMECIEQKYFPKEAKQDYPESEE